MNRLLVVALGVLAVPVQASAATRVSSNSDCPSSDAISLRLLGLLAAGGPEDAAARVNVDEQSMHIDVAAPGDTSQERTVPLAGNCDERAEMAAMIIASWLDAMPAGTIRPPGIPPKERRETWASSGSGDPSDNPDWEPIRTSTRTQAGVGILGLADKQGVNPGLALAAGMPELIEDFGLAVEASVGLYRDLGVGIGTARYWRPTLALKLTADAYRGRWILRVLVGPALGLLLVNGSGYDRNLSDTTVMWGIDFGLALARAWQKREAWISLAAMAWPQGRSIRSTPEAPGSQVALPEWEVRLVTGI